MPRRRQVERSASALNRISAKAQQAAQRLIAESIGEDGQPVVTPQLVESLVRVIEQAGDLSGTLAADLAYAQLEAWGIEPKIEKAPGVDEDRAAARLRWAGTTNDIAANLTNLIDELAKQPYRSTIADTAEASGVRWARVPSGPTTCGFCVMLASRGAVYHSEASAGYSGKKYHANDDCVPTLIRDERDYPEGYDPDALYAEYDAARQAVGKDPVAIGQEITRRRTEAAKAAAKMDDEAETTAGAGEVTPGAPRPTEAEQQDTPEPKGVTWLSDAIKDEDLGTYDSQDLLDLFNEAQDAGDAEAVRRTSAELARREKQTSGYRGTGYTRAELRTQYDEYVERSYWEAEAVTNGHMLNAAGKRAGIDPRSLFKANAKTMLKYASDDLKYHWSAVPRLSFDAFVGDADAIARAGSVDF